MMFFTDKSGTKEAFAKDPAVIKYKNQYFLYYSSLYEVNGKEKWGIGIARSDDGESWTVIGRLPLTQECESNGFCAPAVIELDGKIHMFYQTYGNRERDALCHAVSLDGVSFEKDRTNPIFRPTDDWCVGRAIDADVVSFDGKLFMYFATRDHEFRIQKIGVAYADVSSDFSRGAWTQAVKRAIVHPEFKWEKNCIEAPATVVYDNRVYMFYGGAYNCDPQQIGVAVSLDGVNFDKCFDSPLIPCGREGEWNSDESGHPYAFKDDDGKVWLYYQGTCDKGKSWYLSRKEIGFNDGLPYVKE